MQSYNVLSLVHKLFRRKYFYYALFLLIVTPLIFTTDTNELYEFPKMYFIYNSGTVLISLYFAVELWKNRQIRIPSVAVLLYLLSLILSTLFSTHLYTSIWGYYTRFNDGLVSVLIFVGIYLAIRNKLFLKDLGTLFNAAALSLIPISIYALCQHYGEYSSISWLWSFGKVERIYSTFGQPNWLSQYCVFLMFIPLYNALFGTRRFFWSILFLLAFSSLWFSYSLSGLLGFSISFMAFLILFKKDIFTQKKTLIHVGLFVFIMGIFGIFNLGMYKGKVFDMLLDLQNSLTHNTVVYAQNVGVIQNKIHAVSDPGFIRLAIWNGSIDLATSSAKTFVFGTGPETFPYQFQKYRSKELNYSSEWNHVINKPHNYFIELLTEQGILGLLIYLVLSFKLLRFYAKLRSPLFIGILGFLATNIFGWPTVSTSLLFWVCLAFTDMPINSQGEYA